MKKYILLLIIPFLSFGQSADVDLLKGYNYYDEIHPRLSTFMNEIFMILINFINFLQMKYYQF